ncbi:MAG: mechanosensitive ion channel, partial [Candidatus ainarchaeum sp.]|nr:mechanosensitive ion channel [Candidatus ainarchaeum sp.]
IYYEQLRNMMAGLQLIGGHVREGDYIKVMRERGFVEKIMEQQVIIRDLKGSTILIPNHLFIKEMVKDYSFSEGNIAHIEARINENNPDKIRERLSAVCRKAALNSEQIIKDYVPKIYFLGVKKGNVRMLIRLMIKPNSDLVKIMDVFSYEIKREFGEKVEKIELN